MEVFASFFFFFHRENYLNIVATTEQFPHQSVGKFSFGLLGSLQDQITTRNSMFQILICESQNEVLFVSCNNAILQEKNLEPGCWPPIEQGYT